MYKLLLVILFNFLKDDLLVFLSIFKIKYDSIILKLISFINFSKNYNLLNIFIIYNIEKYIKKSH